MERLLHRPSITRISHKILTPTLSLPPQKADLHRANPLSTYINYINLEFKIQVVCNHFLIEENNEIFLVRQHKTQIFPFVTYQLPVKIFNDRCDVTLEHVLSMKLGRYAPIIKNYIKTITDELINRWITIKDQEATGNSSTYNEKVFGFIIILRLWNVATLRERPWFMSISDRRSNSEVMEMLRRVKVEEIEKDEICVICLEEMGKMEENSEIILLLQMPCLHVFHQECIQRWLSKKIYCPVCRFQMPID